MQKFNLTAAKATAKETTPIESGFHIARVVTVVACGFIPGFNKGDEPREAHGFEFQLEDDRRLAKVMTSSASLYSAMGKLIAALNDVEDLAETLGKTVILEIESNGNWPKIEGFYPADSGLIPSDGKFPDANLVKLFAKEGEIDVDVSSNAEVIGKLPKEIRQALLARPK
jgi:hypothetical protein